MDGPNTNNIEKAKLGGEAKLSVGDRISATAAASGYVGRKVQNDVKDYDGMDEADGRVGNRIGYED